MSSNTVILELGNKYEQEVITTEKAKKENKANGTRKKWIYF